MALHIWGRLCAAQALQARCDSSLSSRRMRFGSTMPRIEERGLRGIRLGDTAQANLAMRRGRQHDVVGLDARQFFEDGTRRVSDPARHFHITKARKHTRMWACKQHHGV